MYMNFNKRPISYSNNTRVCIPIESRVVHTKIQNHHCILKSKVKLLEQIYFEASELYSNGSSVYMNNEEYLKSITKLSNSIRILKKKLMI
jgi:hypothetical protein